MSIVRFPAESLHRDIDELRTELSNITGASEVVDVVLNNGVGSMTLTRKGEQALRSGGPSSAQNTRDFTYALLQ